MAGSISEDVYKEGRERQILPISLKKDTVKKSWTRRKI